MLTEQVHLDFLSEFEFGLQLGWMPPPVGPEAMIWMPVLNLEEIPETTREAVWKWNREGKVANKGCGSILFLH